MNEDKIDKALFEEATLGIIVADSSGKIIKANPFCEQLFGYDRKELQENNIEFLLPHSLRGNHIHHRQQYHKNPIPRSMGQQLDLYGLKKDGSQFPLEISLSHTRIEGELYVIAYINDISKQKEIYNQLLEKKLQMEEARKVSESISEIVEESLNEIYIFDAITLKFLQVNKGARQNMGYTLEEMQKLTPSDIKPEFTKELFLKIIEPLKNGEENNLTFETNHQRKDASTYPVEVHLQYSKMGSQPVFFAIILDITMRKQYEEKMLNYSEQLEQKIKERTTELKQSEAKLKVSLEKEKKLGVLKSRFVSMASHEFRTPLSTILSSANLIAKYEEKDQHHNRVKHIKRIESSVKNLTSILSDFLSLEKLESGKLDNQPNQVNVNVFINNLLEEINVAFNKGHIIKHNHNGENNVYIDGYLVKNILLNLLSNAIKYSPENSVIDVISDSNNGTFEVKVVDNGIGIPLEDQKHMFSRFFRARNARNIEGTGLGLTVVIRYLELINGSIDFISVENEGSTFTIKIPQTIVSSQSQ